jgi:hypothetical protein
MIGYLELNYDETLKTIVSKPVNLTQEFRYFDFINPWDSNK